MEDLDRLLPLVEAFHTHESIRQDDATRQTALTPLLEGSPLGCIWMIGPRMAPVGYIAIAFSWSIEFGGMDAMIDEFFIRENVRGRGMGREVLAQLIPALAREGIVAISLEVDTHNSRAQKLYAQSGFRLREKYSLMSLTLT